MKNKLKFAIKAVVVDVDGTMTDGSIYITESGDEFRRFDVRDGIGIKRMLSLGIEFCILSHTLNHKIIQHRAKMLGIKHAYSGLEPKVKILEAWRKQMQCPYEEIAFIGDDVNDLEVIKKVGLSCSPSDACEAVKARVDHVLKAKGGCGLIREFCEKFVESDEEFLLRTQPGQSGGKDSI